MLLKDIIKNNKNSMLIVTTDTADFHITNEEILSKVFGNIKIERSDILSENSEYYTMHIKSDRLPDYININDLRNLYNAETKYNSFCADQKFISYLLGFCLPVLMVFLTALHISKNITLTANILNGAIVTIIFFVSVIILKFIMHLILTPFFNKNINANKDVLKSVVVKYARI